MMLTKQQAYEYEIGRMNWFQILLSCIPYYHYVLEYQFEKRYQRYIDFYQSPSHNKTHEPKRTDGIYTRKPKRNVTK